MGGSSSRSTQTTTQNLPAGQQRNVDQLLQGALDYYNSGGRVFYPGDVVADFDPLQTQGQNQIVDFAGGAGQNFVNSALAGNQFFMDPNNVMRPENMPGFSGSVDAMTRDFTRNLTENVLPSIRGGATDSGQFGGSASGIGQALAAERSNQGLSDSLSNMYLGAYGMGLDSFNQAMNRAPGMFQLGAAPGQLISAVGDQRQTQAQNEIQGQVARHEFEQNEPMLLLQMLRDMTGQMGTYGGTTQTEATQKTGSSPINTALGGALSLASLWNPMTSLFAGLGNAQQISPWAQQAAAAGVS